MWDSSVGGVGCSTNSGKSAMLAAGSPWESGVRSLEIGSYSLKDPPLAMELVLRAQVSRMVSRAMASQTEWWTPIVRRSPPSMKFACAARTGCDVWKTWSGDMSEVVSLENGNLPSFSLAYDGRILQRFLHLQALGQRWEHAKLGEVESNRNSMPPTPCTT